MNDPLTEKDLAALESEASENADTWGAYLILRLVAEVRRLRAEVDRLEYALEKADAAIRNTSDYR